MIRFFIVYLMCAVGCSAGLEANKPEISQYDKTLLAIVWPAVVTAAIVHISLNPGKI